MCTWQATRCHGVESALDHLIVHVHSWVPLGGDSVLVFPGLSGLLEHGWSSLSMSISLGMIMTVLTHGFVDINSVVRTGSRWVIFGGQSASYIAPHRLAVTRLRTHEIDLTTATIRLKKPEKAPKLKPLL